MLKLTQKSGRITVELGSGRLTWDAARGGQIVALACKNELAAHELLPADLPLAALRTVVDGQGEDLAALRGRLEVVEQVAGERLRLVNTATLAGGRLLLTQTYDVFAEGVMFCEMGLSVAPGASLVLSELSLNTVLDTAAAAQLRWGHFTREPWYKQDYSTTHTFLGKDLHKTRDESACQRELWPQASVDLGWGDVRYFSNRVEFILEEWVTIQEAPLNRTMTRGGREGTGWGLHWYLHEGETLRLTGPLRYRNKWGLVLGTARTRSGKDADPAMRNNALGCRIAHCMYPYARQGSEWPWVMMPIKQVDCQPPQLFKGNPDISRADEAADLGANLMILHQFWMRNPGTNGEPPADYIVNDPKWFRAFVDRCHERDMRVLVYIRGTELWHMYATYFEDYLRQDWDGLYPDWNSPHAMGFTKCSPIHWSAYGYFQYTRAMRRRIGQGGAIIGHTGNTFALAQASLDVALGGEFSVRHDQLLTRPDSAAYFGNFSYSGAHLISGNLPDRQTFSSPRALAMCAAFGMTGHPFMEPNGPFSGPTAYIMPLWNAMRSLRGHMVRMHNPAYSPTRAVCLEKGALFPCLWQGSDNQALLLVTNLDEENAGSGTVALNLKELDVPRQAKLEVLKIAGTGAKAVTLSGSTITVRGLAPNAFAAVRIS